MEGLEGGVLEQEAEAFSCQADLLLWEQRAEGRMPMLRPAPEFTLAHCNGPSGFFPTCPCQRPLQGQAQKLSYVVQEGVLVALVRGREGEGEGKREGKDVLDEQEGGDTDLPRVCPT